MSFFISSQKRPKPSFNNSSATRSGMEKIYHPVKTQKKKQFKYGSNEIGIYNRNHG